MKQLKRILAAVIVFALCLTLFPSMVLAETNAPPFTVTDSSGRSYALLPTTIEASGFSAYYKIIVPENYGSLSFTAQGTDLVYANCAKYCYDYDATSGSTGAFTVSSEHTNSTDTNGSCLFDDSFYNSYKNWNQYVTASGTYVDIQLYFGENGETGYGVLVEIAKATETAPPFTVTDSSGRNYALLSTTIEASGFSAYYKIIVPENYGSLSFTAQGTDLVYANCAKYCYDYDATSGSTGAFTVSSEHTNSTDTNGSCLFDDSFYNSYKNWNQYVTASGTYVDIQLYFGENGETGYGVLVQIGADGDTDAPTLTVPQNAVTRSSHTEATVTFKSDEAGAYYYAIADSNASAPTVNTSGEGTQMVAGDNTITLTDLTAGAKKLYLMAKDESGNVTVEALMIDIPAFIEKTYTLSIFFMPSQVNDGWRILHATADGTAVEIDELGKTVSGIKANQTVNVWFNIPDAAKQLKSVDLITDDADKTAVSTKVTAYNQFQFTMPAANVRSSTNWLELEAATTTRYTLSATVTKLWDHLEYKDTNVKGNVVFTDANGMEITQAEAGTAVTATATPRNLADSIYAFKFTQWKDETGITIFDANRENSTLTFQMPADDVSLFAEFENVGTTVTWGSSPTGAPKVVVNGNTLDETTYVYRTGSTATAYIGEQGWEDGWTFVKWTVTTADGSDYTNVTYAANGNPQVELDGTPVWITAVFEAKAFANVTAKVDENCTGMGSASVTVGSNTDGSCLVYEGQTVTLTATPGARYKFTGWTFVGIDQPADFASDGNTATFTMPKTSTDFTVKASFAVDPDKASSEAILEDAVLYDTDGETLIKNADQEGMNFTITLGAEQDITNLSEMILKFTCSEYATVKQKGASDIWPAAGKPCHMTLDTPVIFVVTSEKGDTTNEYTVEIKQEQKQLSSEKAITSVELIYNGETFATGKLTETETTSTWTVTLKDDIDSTLLGKIGTATDVFMKIDYTGVSLAQEKGYDDATSSKKWDSGNVMCGVSPGGQKKFTVRAEDGSTKDYIIAIIKPNVSEKPTLSDGSATRTSDKEATIKFTSSAAGHYYYKVVESGAAKPDIDTSKGGTNAVADVNTIELSNLTKDARDIYIVVKNAAGDVSEPLMVEIPAFDEEPDEGTFTILYAGPSGGTLVPSKAKANKGDVITVTAVPDVGMQMVAGSMKYTLAVAGGASTPITDGTFIMPSSNVTLRCEWEAVKTSTDGITAFTIDGVAGVVDNTTNTISVVMAYGTDVTKLIPIISGNNIASISPASGQMVDFTNSVRYTVTLTDGTVKYYTVTVYVQEGTAADKMWDKLTDFYDQTPWWEYADHQVSTGRYPKYW